MAITKPSKPSEGTEKSNLETTWYRDPATFWIFLGALGLFAIPSILTKPYWIPTLVFGKPNEIGDTVGGTTGPFIAFIGSVLLYLSIREQRKYNKEMHEETKRQINISTYTNISDEISKEIEIIHKKNQNLRTEITFESGLVNIDNKPLIILFRIKDFLYKISEKDLSIFHECPDSFEDYLYHLKIIISDITRILDYCDYLDDPYKSINLKKIKSLMEIFNGIDNIINKKDEITKICQESPRYKNDKRFIKDIEHVFDICQKAKEIETDISTKLK